MSLLVPQRAFALALKPLNKLTHVHLGIFLSHERMLAEHINHEMHIDEVQSYGPEGCETCQEDEGLYDLVRSNEREACIILARSLRMLKSAGWSSFFPVRWAGDAAICFDAGDQWRATTIHISRQNGRIKARSKPW